MATSSESLFSFNQVMERNLAEQSELAHGGKLSVEDVERLRITFSSQAATCFVCPCLVSLYQRVPSDKHQQYLPKHQQDSMWKSLFGPSALILLMPHFQPAEKFAQSEIILAHLGTCFPLWSMQIYSVTNYVLMSIHFQTVSDDGSSSRAVHGLAFTQQNAATEFSARLNERIKDMTEFESASSKQRRRTVKEREQRSKSMRRLISRSKSSNSGAFTEISSPCICLRVASATERDCQAFSAMAFNSGNSGDTKTSSHQLSVAAEPASVSAAASPTSTMEADGASASAITC